MSEKNHMDELFKKFLDHSISENELNEFLHYIGRSKTEGEVKSWMDEHWSHVKSKVELSDGNENTNDRFKSILSRIETKSELKTENGKKFPISSRRLYTNISIAAAVLLLVGFVTNYFVQPATNHEVVQVEAIQQYSGKQFVELPDGSTLIMNEGSELSFDQSFGEDTREVNFSGEGFFDIAHQPEKPFIVHTGSVRTTVLGTAFNINTSAQASEVVVTVARGKVSVGDDTREYEKILPEQQMIVKKDKGEFTTATVDLRQALAWKEKFLILDGMTIQEAVQLIGKKFNTEIKIENQEIKNCEINAAFLKGESVQQVLRVVCAVLQAEFLEKENHIAITGGRQCLE